MAAEPRRGFSIRIFLPDGTPDGLRIAEKSNWTGRAVVCPRSQFQEAKSRPEFGKAGVYILRGPSDAGDLPAVYIGEGGPARPRLESHNSKKDFWTSFVLFTSKDENVNKAHVQYLEARLVEMARDAKRCVLENGNVPQLPSLSEADAAEMEGFLDEIGLICPVLGVNEFERPRRTAAPRTLLYLRGRGIEGRGYESAEGFVVLAGSQVVKETVPSIQSYLVLNRTSLMERGVLEDNGTSMRLRQDFTFDSPSAAAGVLLGRSVNGRAEWMDERGRTLKEIQADAADSAQDEP